MRKTIYLIFLLFLLIIPYSTAITSTATVEIENFKPIIKLIKIDLNRNNNLTIKAKISDPNGYQDIQSVEIKIVFVNNTEQVYERFGDDYKEAILDSAQATEALYTFSFSMDSNDSHGIYRVKVKVTDGKTETELTTEYSFPQETGMLTGAFLRAPNSKTNIFDLFKRFFAFVYSLFR